MNTPQLRGPLPLHEIVRKDIFHAPRSAARPEGRYEWPRVTREHPFPDISLKSASLDGQLAIIAAYPSGAAYLVGHDGVMVRTDEAIPHRGEWVETRTPAGRRMFRWEAR